MLLALVVSMTDAMVLGGGAAVASILLWRALKAPRPVGRHASQPTDTQELSIQLEPDADHPALLVLSCEVPARLHLRSSAAEDQSFAIPSHHIDLSVPPGGVTLAEFTPSETGAFPFHSGTTIGWLLVLQRARNR